MNSNEWTDKKENLIIKFRDEADALAWKHDHASKYFRKWDKMIGIPGFVLAFVAGNAAFVTAQNDVAAVGYAIAVITLLGGLFSALQNYLSLSDNKQKHKTFASKYLEYYHFTLLLLSQSRNERPKANKYVRDMQQLLQELINKAPEIPSKSNNKYVKLRKDGYFAETGGVASTASSAESIEPEIPVAMFRALGHRSATMHNLGVRVHSNTTTPQATPQASTTAQEISPQQGNQGGSAGSMGTINLAEDSDDNGTVLYLGDDVENIISDGETF